MILPVFGCLVEVDYLYFTSVLVPLDTNIPLDNSTGEYTWYLVAQM